VWNTRLLPNSVPKLPGVSPTVDEFAVWNVNATATTFDQSQTVNFVQSGDYDFFLNVVSSNGRGQAKLYLDGTVILSLSASIGLGSNRKLVTAGNHVIRVEATTQGTAIGAAVAALVTGPDVLISYLPGSGGGGGGGLLGGQGGNIVSISYGDGDTSLVGQNGTSGQSLVPPGGTLDTTGGGQAGGYPSTSNSTWHTDGFNGGPGRVTIRWGRA
jgi:hypothetical protein